MHGREGEEWTKRRRHMWPVPSAALAASVTDAHDSANADALDYFCKDGRKISIGDCALFKPPQETSPPFIGIIRQLTSGKEDYLKLGVNWLYRPADVKLGKGIVPEAAPNEIFYSFHKDEIPAASLLHPCKVAFLRKGVELPPGISSFVCRRVYDTTHKRLWWLTDQDYINERQEEVDQLLDKTRLEMNATVQSGGRSPKPLNGPTTPQLKPGSDGVQNSSTSFPSQGKGKKRGDRVDQGPELVKRERSSKIEDSNSGHFKSESMLKSEIAKITDKGGLVDYDGVEKLVQLMQTDRVEKKIDLAGRIMLADVIAATDRYDCLGKFLQLRGVSVLDEWLQEVHKGKIGDGASIKESDKSVEELLLALLRALDKLPVNLDALQNCNVGKSVNHLRSHKNFEIQKKARGLVETWKKRVEAEWDINDAKSGSNQAVSWPSKSGFPEVSHGGGRLTGGSVETTMKNSVAQLSGSKTAPVKIGHGDSASKLTSALSGSPKVSVSLPAVVAISRDSPGKVAVSSATSDLPSTTVREEKSSSSSQSPNNSQSCSSDHAKTMSSSWKEDGRGSTAGSMNVNKTSGASRHRKSNNGVLGSAVSGVQKETSLVKCCSLDRKATSEKHSQSGMTCDRTHDASLGDHGNNQRLIVRLPNLGRSPARSASGGSFDDPSTTVSRASSPGLAEKHEHCEKKGKVKSEACRTNISADLNGESWQRNAVKDGSIGSDEGNGSLVAVLDEEHNRTGDDIDKALEASKTTSAAPGNHKNAYLSESKPGKLHKASLRSINVLIDSCIKNSEANASVPVADDRGMNLLASVAAGEMSKSDLVSPIGSPGRSSPAPEDSPSGDGSKLRFSCEDDAGQSQGQYPDDAGLDPEKLQTKGGAPHITAHGHAKVPGNSKIMSSEEKPADEQSSQVCTSSLCLQQGSSPCLNTDGQPDEKVTVAAAVPPADVVQEEDADGEGDAKLHEKRKTVAISSSGDSIHDSKSNVRSPLLDESKDFDHKDEKIVDLCKSAASGMVHSSVSETDHTVSRVKVEKETKDLASCPPLERGGESNDIIPEDSGAAVSAESKHSSLMNCNVATEVSAKDIVLPSVSNVLDPTNVDELKSDNAVLVETNAHVEPSENQRVERGIAVPSVADDSLVSEALDQNAHVMDNSDKKEVLEHHTSGSAPQQESNTAPLQETRQGLKSSGAEADGAKDCASAAEATSMSGVAGSDTAAKLDIDLNEGFPVDEGSQVDQVSSVGPGSSSIHLPGPLPFPLSSISSSLPSSITVAAAAKGRFILPENLTRNKGEIGWKGSAATSAFRPAEPRKVLEMPLATTDPLLDIAAAKQGRPPLDIDLNVPDERVLEDMASHSSAQEAGSESGLVSIREFGRNEMLGTSAPVRSAGGLDLDLNRVDEATDVGQFSASTSRRTEVPLLSIRASSSSGFSNGEVNVLRNFDLNNGPGLDEVSVEPAPPRPHPKGNVPFLSPVAGIRMNNNEVSSLSSWFSPGSYPGFAVSSILPDRGEHPYPIVATAGTQRILGPSSGGPTFGPDMYRGPVLSSSPAVAFSPATAPFPYPGFPFGTSFPLPSTSFSSGSTLFMDSSAAGGVCFPAVPSPLVGAASAVSSHYPRPYVISVPDGTANGGAEGSRKWGRQGLDLNAGPGGADVEGRDDRLPSSSRQISISSGQALAEDQVRMYQAAGTVLKRKEPEGGWDAERYNYKQPSWQ